MPLGIDFTQIFLHLLNVVILFTGLYIILYSPVKKFMQAREDHYKKMDDDANEKLANAEQMKAEYSEKLEKVEEEISEKKRTASLEISQMKDKAEMEAKQKADKIIEEAKSEAESKKNNIVSDAKDDIAKMVEDATRKVILTSNVSEAYDLFLDDAERSAD